jgi:hypothetical protein
MHTLISPHSRTALVFDTGRILLLDDRAPESEVPMTADAAACWLAAHEDCQWREADDLGQGVEILSLWE